MQTGELTTYMGVRWPNVLFVDRMWGFADQICCWQTEHACMYVCCWQTDIIYDHRVRNYRPPCKMLWKEWNLLNCDWEWNVHNFVHTYIHTCPLLCMCKMEEHVQVKDPQESQAHRKRVLVFFLERERGRLLFQVRVERKAISQHYWMQLLMCLQMSSLLRIPCSSRSWNKNEHWGGEFIGAKGEIADKSV